MWRIGKWKFRSSSIGCSFPPHMPIMFCSLENWAVMEVHPFPDLKVDSFDFLDELHGRSVCPNCKKSRKYYCYNCYVPVEGLQDRVPKIQVRELSNYVLASRASGCHLGTQTLKNPTSGHPITFVTVFKKCQLQANDLEYFSSVLILWQYLTVNYSIFQ